MRLSTPDITDPFEPGLVSRLPFPLRKVALLRASRIGDFVCATPAFRALRLALPGARLSLIALPQVRELAARCPYLDEFICFPGYPGIADQYFEPSASTAFFAEMQAREFDLAIQMHGSGVFSNPVALMLGARATAGFIRAEDSAGRLDAAMIFPSGEHTVRGLLRLLDFLGIPPRGEHVEFRLLPEDQAAAEALLAGIERPLIGVNPAARDPRKIWPSERFALTACRLRLERGGTVVIIGGPEDRDRRLGERLAGFCGPPVINLAGRESLSEMGAVISQLDVLVTNDSGPAHIAYALGTPTVTVFGFTDPAEWGPLEPERHRVVAAMEPDSDAPERRILGIGIEQVTRAARDVMRAA